MAKGTLELNRASGTSSKALYSYVEWSSSVKSGKTQTITFNLYLSREDGWSADGKFSASNNSGSWNSSPYYSASGTSAVLPSNKNSVLMCTRALDVTVSNSGVANINVTFEAWFVSSSAGKKSASITITSLQLDKPTFSVSVKNTYSGISCSASSSSAKYDDIITVNLSISNTTVWKSASFSISGATLYSGTRGANGSKYKVTGDVSIVVSAVYQTYKITISSGTGGSTVVKDSNGIQYSSGSSVTYGTKLTITSTANSGYELKSITAGTTALSSGGSVTITGATTITVVFSPLGLVHIFNGSGWDSYQVYIFNGSGWDMYCPYIFDGSQWKMCA